jgi:phage terminase Nu1 subunit (DNA packaging protein)
MESWNRLYCAHLREQAAGRATIGEINLATERAMLAKEQRLRLEMQNAVTRREYAPIEAMEIGLSHGFSRVGSQLDTIVGKLRKRSDVLTVNDLDLVSEVIATVRNDIANMTIDWFDDADLSDIDVEDAEAE